MTMEANNGVGENKRNENLTRKEEQPPEGSFANNEMGSEAPENEMSHWGEGIAEVDYHFHGNMNEETKAEIRRQVDKDAEEDTGRPTGAIYGRNGDIRSVPNEFPDTENE